MNDLLELDPLSRSLRGSRDPVTGQVYFPFRPLAADGSLRACEPIALSRVGTLYSWTRFGSQDFGQVDLPEGVRIQTRLETGPHDIGRSYELMVDDAGDDKKTQWRFRRA